MATCCTNSCTTLLFCSLPILFNSQRGFSSWSPGEKHWWRWAPLVVYLSHSSKACLQYYWHGPDSRVIDLLGHLATSLTPSRHAIASVYCIFAIEWHRPEDNRWRPWIFDYDTNSSSSKLPRFIDGSLCIFVTAEDGLCRCADYHHRWLHTLAYRSCQCKLQHALSLLTSIQIDLCSVLCTNAGEDGG